MVFAVLTGGFGFGGLKEGGEKEIERRGVTVNGDNGCWGSGAKLLWSCYHMHGVTELHSPLRLWWEMSLLAET